MGLMNGQAIGLAIVMVLAGFGTGMAANAPPRAGVLAVDVVAGVPTAFVLPGSDEDGDPLTYTILGGLEHGRLEGVAPHLTYVSAAGFLGADQVTYTVTDPYGAMDLGMVRFQVRAPITTHRIGQPAALFEAGLASLAAHLVAHQVTVWYIFGERAAAFAVGQPIPVVLPPGGVVSWVGFYPIGSGCVPLVPVAGDWNPRGLLRVATQSLSAGTYILTVVKERQAFSFLITLTDTPAPDTQHAVNEPRDERGG
jgi:hypothetical protein